MKWLEMKVVYEAEDYNIARDIIANIFYEFGVQGLEIGEPMSKNALDYYNDEKLFLEDDHYVSGYFPHNAYLEDKIKVFSDIVDEKCEANDILYKIITLDVADEDWSESWKRYFLPEKITNTLVVKPTWQDYEPTLDEKIINIDPGMAFGTGTHPTTYLCMNMLEKYISPDDEVLDVGTGSGILMVAAKKLGAGKTVGIDIDELAVKVAEENLNLNEIAENEYELYKGDLIECLETREFDIVVSNILAEVIVVLLDDIKKVLKKDAKIILSGIINDKKDIVQAKLEEIGMECVEMATKGEWVAIVGRYRCHL
jgi:ribosomal protein L11 methyltransferase